MMERKREVRPPLILVPADMGFKFPVRYVQGGSPGVPSAKFVEWFQSNPHGFRATLEQYYTEHGKAYFSTDEGKLELERLILKVEGYATKRG